MRDAMIQSTQIYRYQQFGTKDHRGGESHQHAISLLEKKAGKKHTQEAIIQTLVNSEDGNTHKLAIAFYPDTVKL